MTTSEPDAGRRSPSNPREWLVRAAPTAAYFLFQGASLLRLQPEDPAHPDYFNFVFRVDERLEEAVREWRSGEAEDFLRFSEAQTALFQRINSAKAALGGGR